MASIDVYPVGVFATVQQAVRHARHGDWIHAADNLRWQVRYLIGCVRQREWRRIRKAFNGYLAEPRPFPEGLTRCGRGWTRRAALRSLHRQMQGGHE